MMFIEFLLEGFIKLVFKSACKTKNLIEFNLRPFILQNESGRVNKFNSKIHTTIVKKNSDTTQIYHSY